MKQCRFFTPEYCFNRIIGFLCLAHGITNDDGASPIGEFSVKKPCNLFRRINLKRNNPFFYFRFPLDLMNLEPTRG